MTLIKDKYSYVQHQRKEIDGNRFYLDSNGNPVASVTTILAETKPPESKEQLENWKRRVGHEEANRITKQSTDIGTMVHEAVEAFYHGHEWDTFPNTDDGRVARKMTQTMMDHCLPKINEVWGLEVSLVMDDFYAGTADCIGIYNNKESIIDFKTSRKMKKKEWIEDYFLQCVAYANAHNKAFNTNIKQLVVLMVDRLYLHKVFVIPEDEFELYTQKWRIRLSNYLNMKFKEKNGG